MDALDEFDSRYLESYHQVTAKLASLAIGCTLRLSSPLLGPRDLEDVPRLEYPGVFDLNGEENANNSDCNFSSSAICNSTNCNSPQSTHSTHLNLNNPVSINIHTSHNAVYTTNYGPGRDEASLASIGHSIGPNGPSLGASIDTSAGAPIGSIPPCSPNPSAGPSCAAFSRSNFTPIYPASDLRPGMRRTLSLLKPARAESIRPNPLGVRLLLALLITPKPRRIERRNTVATYVGNPFYRGRGSPNRKLPASFVRLLGENLCTFELGETPLTGRGRPGEESIFR